MAISGGCSLHPRQIEKRLLKEEGEGNESKDEQI